MLDCWCYGNETVCMVIVVKIARDIDRMNFDCPRRLVQATISRDLKEVKRLLEIEEVDVNFMFTMGYNYHGGRRPFSFAIDSKDPEILKAFLKCTRLDLTLPIYDVESEEFKCEDDDEFNPNCKDYTPLEYAVIVGWRRGFQLIYDFLNGSPLTCTDIVTKLIKYSINNHRNDKLLIGKILNLAIMNGAKVDAETILNDALEQNFSFFLRLIKNKTLIKCAKPDFDAVTFVLKVKDGRLSVDEAIWLRGKGIVDSKMTDGKTLFMHYLEIGEFDIAERLIKEGANIGAKDDNGAIGYIHAKDHKEYLNRFKFTVSDFNSVIQCTGKTRKGPAIKEALKKYPEYREIFKKEAQEYFLSDPYFCNIKSLFSYVKIENTDHWFDLFCKISSAEVNSKAFEQTFNFLSEKLGTPFVDQFNSRKIELFHAIIGDGRMDSDFLEYLVCDFKADFDSFYNGKTALMKLFSVKSNDYFSSDILISAVKDPNVVNEEGKFFHQTDLLISETLIDFVIKLYASGIINIFEPSPKTGKHFIEFAFENGNTSDKNHLLTELTRKNIKVESKYVFEIIPNISYSIQEIFEDSDSIDIDELLNFRREGDSVLHAMARKEFNEYVWKNQKLSQAFLNLTNSDGKTPLEVLILLGNQKQISKCVKFLVSHKKIEFINDVMDKIDTIKPGTFDKILQKYYSSIFEYALCYNNFDYVKMLIEEYGIDPNTKIRMQFNDGFPVDTYCRWYLHSEEPVPFETLFYLFEKGSLYQSNCNPSWGNLRDFIAMDVSWSELITFVLNMGYDFTYELPKLLEDLADVVWIRRSLNMTNLIALLIHPKVREFFDSEIYSYALAAAVTGEHVKILLELGADPWLSIGPEGETPMHYAAGYLDEDAWKELKNIAGIKFSDLLLNRDAEYSPLDYVRINLEPENLEKLFECFPDIKICDAIVLRLSESKDKNVLGDGDSCALCRADFLDDEDLLLLECKHLFHYSCIFRKFGSCPLCKKPILINSA